jgi:hypothetical protein
LVDPLFSNAKRRSEPGARSSGPGAAAGATEGPGAAAASKKKPRAGGVSSYALSICKTQKKNLLFLGEGRIIKRVNAPTNSLIKNRTVRPSFCPTWSLRIGVPFAVS